ncbi:hypothetical protein A0H76_2251 [Hepatospora eriocheir]|uniref:Uncharacterized protein n=1 Tax=Hepatospora eriocheir TaxID=1081669 RepID=A0A1X0QFZ2_9MICR|nr:hypothetical protein A0H76_2251 [Hepatospora eriocheir]
MVRGERKNKYNYKNDWFPSKIVFEICTENPLRLESDGMVIQVDKSLFQHKQKFICHRQLKERYGYLIWWMYYST